MLPTPREVVAEQLVSIWDSTVTSGDGAIAYLGRDLGVGVACLGRCQQAIDADDSLGALLFLRVLIETTIRIMWVAEGVSTGDEAAGDSVRRRLAALERRDILNLAEAQTAINEVSGMASALSEPLRAMAASIDVEPAPKQLRSMAGDGAGKGVYASYRLCSNLVHPGPSLGRHPLLEVSRIQVTVDQIALVLTASAAKAARAIELAS